ncbi:hypothetical protein PP180_11280 [Muricauda sp. SK9]|uniref:hypothetical protein n=1 Tax=Flavobacteriaceae TaxID=49546 RepID=UPI0011C4A059|nr:MULTISPECIES: hypothetical protein [Allomuricauda]MDC6385951.1 hypothetical protein [Muricauda sp. SK9]
MSTIILKRSKDYMIIFRALKIYVNGEFIDYFEPNEKSKEIVVEAGSTLNIKVDWCSSNTIKISKRENQNIANKDSLIISSQIHNGLFILIFGCFIIGNLLMILDYINPFAYLALISPIAIIVGWQIFGRNNYLRISKLSN